MLKTELLNTWNKKSIHISGILAILAFLPLSQVQAASLQVAPILIEFSSADKAKELWLTNTGSTNIRAQVRVQQWTQQNSQDNLAATKNLIASPLITEVKPGQRQLVRLIKPAATPINQEQAFRLIVDELPDNKSNNNKTGLNILLQYSIPVFYKTNQKPMINQGITSIDRVQFKYAKGQLTATNLSNSYIRLSQLSYVSGNGKKSPLFPGLVGYVLVGQTMSWILPAAIPSDSSGKFQAVINSDFKEQTLPVQK
ncbi:molecular chaperone [Acinetobacter sp. NS-4]|uniref:fimbrial biogenesis chaperone n=1 Tax=Acinetobacter sp. NS-4 TaxID=3127956 RepID=UPI00307DE8E5